MHKHTHTYIYTYIHTYTHICIYTHIFFNDLRICSHNELKLFGTYASHGHSSLQTCRCTYDVCVYVCMHKSIDAYTNACACIHTYTHTCIHTYMHTDIHTHIHPHIHTCIHYTYADTHTCIYA